MVKLVAILDRPCPHCYAKRCRRVMVGQHMFYTYVLLSNKDKELYIGWTNDLKMRLEAHNKGQVLATKHRTPLKIIYYEACLEKDLAIAREKQLKTGFGRAYLKRRLKYKHYGIV